VAVEPAGPYASLHLSPDRQPCQHPTAQFFTGRMPFLPHNQQCQSTEGKVQINAKIINTLPHLLALVSAAAVITQADSWNSVNRSHSVDTFLVIGC